MKSSHAFASLPDFPPTGRGKKLGTATLLCVALLPGSMPTVAQENRALEIQRMSISAPSSLLHIGEFGIGGTARKILPAGEPKPTKETVLALADKYRKVCEANLDFKSRQIIEEINRRLASTKGVPSLQKQMIDGLVSQLTIALAGLKKLDTLIVASAILVQTAPGNPRPANLFGSALHTSNELGDAVKVLEYTLALKPESTLAKLNLANAYLDVKEDEKAKALADKVVFEDGDNMAAHRVLATYWYGKRDLGAFRAELLKASKFKGYVKNKLDRKKKRIEDNSGGTNDSTEVLGQKARKLEEEVPLTTADIIADEFPSQANRIRAKYGKLVDQEKMVMPKLPELNMNTPADYMRNQAIIAQWAQVIEDRSEKFEKEDAARRGIDMEASGEVQRAQEEAAQKKQAAEAMRQALQMLESAKSLPGANLAELNQTIAELKKEMQEQGITEQDISAAEAPAGLNDAGSQLVLANYGNYLRIYGVYGIYFAKYYSEFQEKVDAIFPLYNEMVQKEDDFFGPRWDKLQEEHNRVVEGSDYGPHGKYDIPCEKEMLRHNKKLNEIADYYYKDWVNLYAPQYAQKMKPALDAFWNICMLYVRIMNDPKVMEREYVKVKRTYMIYAYTAASLISGGDQFRYVGTTHEEEEQLSRDISAAEAEARRKKPQMEKDFQDPGVDWSTWIEDHASFEASGEFLGLKITAKTIEFEAWLFGPGASLKYDMVDNKLETSLSLGAKLKVGVKIGGYGVDVEAKADVARKVAQWDFDNGTYEESYGGKGEAKAAFGPIAAGGEVEVDAALNAKATLKITVGDMATIQTPDR